MLPDQPHCELCQTNPKSCNSLHIFYLIGSILTMCGCVFVISTYMYNARLREHPAVLIFSRCLFDFVFGACFFVHFFLSAEDLACNPTHCTALGTIIFLCFLCSQGYFAASIYDLYTSLSNPFSQPNTLVKRAHIIIITVALGCTLFVYFNYSFEYRIDLQYCAISPSHTDVNPYNTIFIYIPISILIFSSISVNIYAIKRLRLGLEDTFYVRMQAIKDSLFYCLGYSLYFIVIGLCYFMVWNDDQKDANLQGSNAWHYLYALTVAFLGLNDFCLWVYRQFTYAKKKKENAPMYAKIAMVDSLNAARKKSLRRNEFVGKQFIAPALPQHIAYMELQERDDVKDNKCTQFCKRLSLEPTVGDQSINKALRREVLAYTTDGIAQCIDRQIKSAEMHYTRNSMHIRDGLHDEDYPRSMNDLHGRTIQRFNITIKHNRHLLYEDEDSNTSSDNDDPQVNIKRKLDKSVDLDIDDNDIAGPAPSPVGVQRIATKLVVGDEPNSGIGREFVDFAPIVFKFIRNYVLGIEDQSYNGSIIPKDKYAQRNVLDAKYGEGKSGAFFYFSHDSRYLVKTIKKFEVDVMLHKLKEYVEYIVNNPNTILSRVVGLHSIQLYGLTKYFLVTENVFLSDLKPSEVYDLKGSWVNRYTEYSIQSGKTLKDGDLKRFVVLNKKTREQLIKQLQSDSEFLSECNVMDYSLLLGVYHMKMCVNEDMDEKDASINSYAGGIRAEITEGPGLYFMGIIDTLQDWNVSKKMEHFTKTWVLRQNKLGISCIEPNQYQKRFMNYCKNIIVTDEEYFEELTVNKREFENQSLLVYPGKAVVEKSMFDAQKSVLPK